MLLSLGTIQPLVVAELSPDELRMKERLVALSLGAGALEGLRIEVARGCGMMPTYRSYNIADGKVRRREWTSIGGEEIRGEQVVTDMQFVASLGDWLESGTGRFKGRVLFPMQRVSGHSAWP